MPPQGSPGMLPSGETPGAMALLPLPLPKKISLPYKSSNLASPLNSQAVCNLPFLPDSINGVVGGALSHKAAVRFTDYILPGVVGRGKGELLCNGYIVSVWEHEKFRMVAMVAQHCERKDVHVYVSHYSSVLTW